MIYLYLFGTCFHFIYVFMIIGNICTQKYYHDAIRIITEKVNDAVFYVFLMILAGYKLIWIYPMLFM